MEPATDIKPLRRRGGQPGNTNRLVHGRSAKKARIACTRREAAWLKDVAFLVDTWRSADRDCPPDRKGPLVRATIAALSRCFQARC